MYEPEDGVGISVYVEDCDGGEDGTGGEAMREVDESEWVYGETNPVRAAWRPPVTARPPMPIAV